ncbi:cadherin-89D isoform X2 [Cephus cinctus]|uniref:Cadherin-89D isoform X2 n=1 Tax=Cephus cinctus TaxID=211228 RepID=A0AAJ7C587_CEPCN|nr:cadherin-89D isoform X2 [Cephus cinctus]
MEENTLTQKCKDFRHVGAALLLIVGLFGNFATGCQFYPSGEYLKFVRVPENLPRGAEVLSLEVHPRNHLSIMPVDKEEDTKYFTYKDVNKTHAAVILAKSLENLVDGDAPRNLLKFRLVCDYTDGSDSLVSSHLSVTVYVEDVNDHAPQFVDAPYHLEVDELTPTGLTIFRDIHAVDKDKPNTPNSDVHYAIVKGNERGKFSLEPGHRTALTLRKSLDYDNDDREFVLTVMASDRGTPMRSTNTTVTITVLDNDDLNPKFSQPVYRTKIYEFYPAPNYPIHVELNFTPPIYAEDQDRDLDVDIRYDIISGNEKGLFYLNPQNGSLFLEQAIDLDSERNLPGNTYTLQIQASQTDNPLKLAVAKVEIEILDLNDNLPEFEVDFYNISIVENLPNGFSVLQVIATDKDQGDNGEFDYELEDPSGAFSVDPNSGWLTVRDQTILDREQQNSLRMKVFARERRPSVVATSSGSSSVDVEVTLLDANDNNPTFVPSNLYEFVTKSDAAVGTALGQVQAVDNDLGRNGMVLYKIQKPGNTSIRTPFTVDEHTGIISVAQSPLIEGRHAIFVEAADQPTNPSERRFSLAVVTVDVFRPGGGHNSWEPDFVGAPYEFWVGANVGIGTSVGQIRVNDAVKTSNLIYDLLHSYHEGVPFAVEERSGTITVVDEIEQFDRSLFDFEAVVTNERDLTLVTNVSIHVVDPNDERGIFTQGTTKAPLIFHVKENVPGAFIGQVLPHNATNTTRNIHFIIANQQDVPDIAITEDGVLYTPRGLDREERQNYSITVIAESLRGVGIFQVTVIVEDENDNPPVFSMSTYEGRLLENSPVGTEITMTNRILAHDPDDNGDHNVVLTLHGEGSELFTIDQTSGRVFFRGENLLDREEVAEYHLRIVARDKGNMHSEAQLVITVDDENDNPPNFKQMIILPDQGVHVANDTEYQVKSVLKNGIRKPEIANNNMKNNQDNDHQTPLLLIPENSTVGTIVIRLSAEDKDSSNTELTYSIINETISDEIAKSNKNRHFAINPITGEVSVARSLPAETEIHLTLRVTDSGNQSDNVTVRFHILDINNHPPVFKKSWYTFSIPEGTYEKRTLGTVDAIDADYDDNANITYDIIRSSNESSPFSIEPHSGLLKATGILDRETLDVFRFSVVARDQALNSLSSSVDVEINVLDVNDNAPVFYGYDALDKLVTGTSDIFSGDTNQMVPTYYASVPENSPVGTIVTRVYANDSDFAGNGNGLILFDLPHRRGDPQYFSIDSKEGLVSTVANLDYEIQRVHNLTVIASDLGSPSLTSTAMLLVRILDVDEGDDNDVQRPIFQHRYYEVEVEENTPVPLKLVQLNVSGHFINEHLRYSIVQDDSDAKDHFMIDRKNGTLYLVTSIDRELRDLYEVKVRVDRVKNGRGMPVMIYPVVGERLNGLALNEAKITVRVKDVNDNAPRFKAKGRPMLAAIPTTAHYGYEIIKVEAEDPDQGINGEIRYQILGREDAPRFAIDPLSGQVRSVGSFSRDAGRVFGFDVKATDRRGAEDGRSSIANVFVYVLDDHKQVVMVMGNKPRDIELQIDNITSALHNVTGLDVRVRKLEPHIEKNLIDAASTDMYLYAIDPHLNVMIDMDTLHNVFHNKKTEIKRELERYHVLDIAGTTPRRSNQRYLLSTLEVGVVVLGCVVFVGALITALCVTCFRRNKRRQRQGTGMYSSGGPVGFALADPTATLQKPPLFPTFVDGLHYDPEPFSSEMRHHGICEHEPSCVRFHRTSMGKRHTVRTSTGTLEASATSLHSSGQDSGIVARTCHCSHSSSPSSGESSKSVFYRTSRNGYEDSLRSLHRRSGTNDAIREQETNVVSRRANLPASRRRQRFHSFANTGSVYSQEASLKRDKRLRPDSDKRRGDVIKHEHRRALSEAENNITETVIHEHPSAEMTIPTPLPNVSTLHGKTHNVVVSTPAAMALARRQSVNVMYGRPT